MSRTRFFRKGVFVLESLYLLWQPDEEGAVLVRAAGESPCPVFPDRIEGRAVTGIGPYCFSPRLPRCEGAVYRSEAGSSSPARRFETLAEALEGLPGTELCGEFLQAVELPAGVKILHSAAFYNCRRLECISFGADVRRVGSDCFTNCFALHTLRLRADWEEPTGLPKLAAGIQSFVTAEFADPKGQVTARLCFPEYADQIEENSPAHIFNHSFVGVGYHYRQCFGRDNRLQPGEYDRCFARALPLETEGALCRIALARLRWPVALSGSAAEAYRDCCRGHGAALAALLLEAEDMAGLEFVCAQKLLEGEALTQAVNLASGKGKTQAAALLMKHRHLTAPAPKKKTYDFDF